MTTFKNTAEHKSDSKDIQRAKRLRLDAPMPERLLWESLRQSAKANGLRFRRQHPIHPYVVDFVCLKAKLVIEIDGPSHDIRVAQDIERDKFLNNLGYKVLRFTNGDVRNHLSDIVTTIINEALKQMPSPYAPLP